MQPFEVDQADQNMLEDVLFQYVESAEKPTHKALMEWVGRYPEHKTQLIEFTVAWSQLERLPLSAQQNVDVDETTLVLREMSVVKNLLHEMADKTLPRVSRTLTDILAAEQERMDVLAEREDAQEVRELIESAVYYLGLAIDELAGRKRG